MSALKDVRMVLRREKKLKIEKYEVSPGETIKRGMLVRIQPDGTLVAAEDSQP